MLNFHNNAHVWFKNCLFHVLILNTITHLKSIKINRTVIFLKLLNSYGKITDALKTVFYFIFYLRLTGNLAFLGAVNIFFSVICQKILPRKNSLTLVLTMNF